MTEVLTSFKEYAVSLERFVGFHRLPESWFYVPDHFALKCADATDFEATMKEWEPLSQEMGFVELNGRKLGSAKLNSPIPIGRFGEVKWLEFMEPRPEKVGKDTVGVDHAEFFFPDFKSVTNVLKQRGVVHELQQNPSHEWVTIIIGNNGEELKLNNGTLADVVIAEREQGLLTDWISNE